MALSEEGLSSLLSLSANGIVGMSGTCLLVPTPTLAPQALALAEVGIFMHISI